MPARRVNKFVGGGHREHRAKKSRDPHYRFKREGRLIRKFKLEKEIEDEDNQYLRDSLLK